MLQVVSIRNKYMFSPCLALQAVSALTEHCVFCECCLPFIPIKGWNLGAPSLSLFLSCPKKNVIVMTLLTRGDGKRDKQEAS